MTVHHAALTEPPPGPGGEGAGSREQGCGFNAVRQRVRLPPDMLLAPGVRLMRQRRGVAWAFASACSVREFRSRTASAMPAWRSSTLRTLPLTVIGKASMTRR